MIIFEFLITIAKALALLWIFADIVCWIRTKKYQKIWNKERAMLEKSNPKPKRADICEQYVMFCLRNDCKVDF